MRVKALRNSPKTTIWVTKNDQAGRHTLINRVVSRRGCWIVWVLFDRMCDHQILQQLPPEFALRPEGSLSFHQSPKTRQSGVQPCCSCWGWSATELAEVDGLERVVRAEVATTGHALHRQDARDHAGDGLRSGREHVGTGGRCGEVRLDHRDLPGGEARGRDLQGDAVDAVRGDADLVPSADDLGVTEGPVTLVGADQLGLAGVDAGGSRQLAGHGDEDHRGQAEAVEVAALEALALEVTAQAGLDLGQLGDRGVTGGDLVERSAQQAEHVRDERATPVDLVPGRLLGRVELDLPVGVAGPGGDDVVHGREGRGLVVRRGRVDVLPVAERAEFGGSGGGALVGHGDAFPIAGSSNVPGIR